MYKESPIQLCIRYGPDGRSERDYNVTELHDSRVAKALKGIGYPIPSDEKIYELRSSSDIKCRKPEKASPCKPTQQVMIDECKSNCKWFFTGLPLQD